MSLYGLQKLLFLLNREPDLQAGFKAAPEAVLSGYDLTEEERAAVLSQDIGLLYVLGVNGQILMHFAAFCGLPWAQYIEAMRDGVRRYGPVRAGIYAMTTTLDDKVAGV
jgi:hypothetical protein